jgi:hypothetical protein
MLTPNTEAAPPCRFCRGRQVPVTCTCRGCADLAYACECPQATDEIIAREGLCDGCSEAGCIEGVASFTRCRRLAPAAPTVTSGT